MNHIPKINLKIKEISHFIFGCSLALFSVCAPLQTTINSELSKQMHSSLFAALVSFTVGTIALFILTIIFNRSLKLNYHNIISVV